jgi:hypothetical protein
MGQIDCDKVNELLSAYLENELDAAVSMDIAGHLEHCSICRRESEQLTEITKLVKRVVIESGEKEVSLATRAATVNERVRASIADSMQQSAGDPRVVPITRPQIKGRWVRRLALAAAIVISVGFLGLFSLSYFAHGSGPLLTGVARGHRVCAMFEKLGLGWYKGERVAEFIERYNFSIPELNRAGLKIDGVHPCNVSKTSFVHLLYMKDSRPISVYCGSEAAVDRLRETEGQLTPGKLYSLEGDSLRVSAFTTPGKRIWIVAGELTASEMDAITSNLTVDSTSQSLNRGR